MYHLSCILGTYIHTRLVLVLYRFSNIWSNVLSLSNYFEWLGSQKNFFSFVFSLVSWDIHFPCVSLFYADILLLWLCWIKLLVYDSLKCFIIPCEVHFELTHLQTIWIFCNNLIIKLPSNFVYILQIATSTAFIPCLTSYNR